MYKQDCIYFLSDRPCKFHKENPSINCITCKFYTPVEKKILIIKLSALGDVLRTTSILKPLHKRYKNAKVYWITEDNAIEVLYNNPYITEIIPFSHSFLLFNQKVDIMINLDLEKKSLLLTRHIMSYEKYGFYLNDNDEIVCSNNAAKQWFDLSHNDVLKKKNKKTYQQYMMEILEFDKVSPKDYPIVIRLTQQEKDFAKKFLSKHQLTSSSNYFVGINLGGGDRWKKKEYPVEQTVELVKYIVTNKNKKDIKVLLYGGVKEKERNKRIIELFTKKYPQFRNKVIDTGCENSLREFFSLLNLSDVVITSDSLALHVALGLRKKIVALFGPTSANEIEMYSLGVKIVSPKSCVCCYNQSCDKVNDCMSAISPFKVYKKLLEVM